MNIELSTPKRTLIDEIVRRLCVVKGVRSIVLGGSTARGSHTAASDLDIGIYYCESQPFQIGAIRKVAEDLSDGAAPVVTDFYEWGAWVNGGAWINTPVCKVDFLYRNLNQVQRAIDDAKHGITHHDYDQQPAFGFYSVTYLAETSVCLPLYDPYDEISGLKAQVDPYPPVLKEKTIASMLWMAEFSLIHSEGFAGRGDVYAAVGTLARVASFLIQALYALNETYFISEKAAFIDLPAFPILPNGYVGNISAVLAHPGLTSDELAKSTRSMRQVWESVVRLTHGKYQPAFKI